MNNHRLALLRASMKKQNLDGLLVTHLPHIRYISGFSGSSGQLLLTRRGAWFITDFRYQEQAAAELRPDFKTIITSTPHETIAEKKLIREGMKIGFQDSYTTVAALAALRKKFRKVKFAPTGAMVTKTSMVKTPDEVAAIRTAADIAARVYQEILGIVKPGMRENEVAMEISYLGKKFGSQGDAFDIIVASGPRGALPHGRASTKKIKSGELVTLDFGCIHNGFNSDMTRTFAVGKPSPLARKIYDIVLNAEQAGVNAARAGMTGKELDDVCRNLITEAGYGDKFGHSTGHGLGIEVHEQPGVSFRSEKQILPEGAVVTIEPGIYLPDQLGVRIEDDVLLTATGCTVLTSSPRELIIV
ncbi:MAG: aminopeptidase P family protein [Chlorobi bacterium CHB2]|nr:aminopeptidase P family protein [Chlorobi bacterium CHB2]